MSRASDNRACPARRTRLSGWCAALGPIGLAAFLSAGCSDRTPPPSPPCERECQDAVALRAVREMMKFAFNHTFQSKDVGYHDLTTDKFLRGSARVFGTAMANGEQGVTDVKLTYVFTQAVYPKKEDEPEENYVIGLDGTIEQEGMIAVQPSSPTALKMTSQSVTVVGVVYDPPINYYARQEDGGAEMADGGAEMGCTLEIVQSGNSVAGKFCGRDAGFGF
jgi:hypothetical protein